VLFFDLTCLAQQAKDYDEAIIVGDSLFRKYRFNDALVEYKKALEILPHDAYTQVKIKRIEQINNSNNKNSEEFNHCMATGISFLDQNKFIEALKSFKKARNLLPENTEPDKYILKTKEAKISLEEKLSKYSKEIELANKYIDTEEYLKAINHLKKAQEILPDNWAIANEIKNYNLLAEKQLNDTKINEIENKQADLKLSKPVNNEITSRKYLEVIPDITEYSASPIQYNTSTSIVSESAPAIIYQPEIDIIIEQNQKEIDKIATNLVKFEEIDAKYTAQIENAEDLYSKGQFHNSRILFISASQVKPLEQKPNKYIATIDSILRNHEIQKHIYQQYNSYIVKGDSLLNLNLFDKSITAFTKAATIIPGDTLAHYKRKIAENKKIEFIRANQTYDETITVADNLYKSSNFVEALVQYKIACDIKPDESYPKNKIAEINAHIETELKHTRDKYDIAIANADKLYSVKIYDEAIDEYRKASNTLPDESYPDEMISKIINLMEVNAILNIFNDTITINAETTKRFVFEPVSIDVRRNSYIFFKATNLSGNMNKLIVNFGSNKGKNGGFVVVLAEGVERNDYIIRVGNQYKWFADDNNWISIYPQKGDIQLSMMQISKSN
jgi:tetratricopeptide (TPR) repeat protein